MDGRRRKSRADERAINSSKINERERQILTKIYGSRFRLLCTDDLAGKREGKKHCRDDP